MITKVTQEKIDFSPLFSGTSFDFYKQAVDNATATIAGFLKQEDFYSGISVTALQQKMTQYSVMDSTTIKLTDALKDLEDLYVSHAIAFHHPNYIAHLNCPVTIAALIADMLASAINTAVETWDQSTAATLIEKDIIHWICTKLKLPALSADGIFTSGGTQSNLMGMLLARDHHAQKKENQHIKTQGASADISRYRIFCSEKAHFSIQKSAAILGMGYQSVIAVKTDENHSMCPKALEIAITKEMAQNNIPIAIVATAGTTDFGSIDPIAALDSIAKKHQLWLHVDAAYGGSFIVCKTKAKKLEDIAYADSVTIDFHKAFFQPVCSSVFLVRDKTHFKYVSHYANYLNPKQQSDTAFINLVDKSIQTTRRFDALKMWLTLKVTSEKTIGQYLDKVCMLTQQAYMVLQGYSCFELAHKPELSTIVFRYILPDFKDPKTHNRINLYIKQQLFNTGKASIASTKIHEVVYLKFTILNPQTTIEDITNIIEMITEKAKNYGKTN